MATRELPDAAYLRECFDYDPETGVLTWKCRPRDHFESDHAWECWNARFPGQQAGSREGQGYICIGIDNTRYKAHRVIWVFQTGDQPPTQIDHRNHDRADNRWSNLRAATQSQNSFNGRAKRRFAEYPWPRNVWKDGSRFRSYAQVNGRRVHLGMFDTPEAAYAAWREFASRQLGEFFPDASDSG